MKYSKQKNSHSFIFFVTTNPYTDIRSVKFTIFHGAYIMSVAFYENRKTILYVHQNVCEEKRYIF